ncbi:MAG: hypothetical protein EOO73_25510 [Myxococcales bacterium]|nr:MAG: hypothetical protein EOO73_25510 [Myxococcales bacterium]
MVHIRRAERNKQPGVCYAVTNDGLELPVVDVTHPAFACELSAEKEARLVQRFLKEQRRFARLPAWLRIAMVRFFLRGSRIARGVRRAEGTFLDAMTTYLFKLGPQNLGSYAVPADRIILRSLPAISVRLRVHDMARLLAEELRPRLDRAPQQPLFLVNIAGGPAIDSLNALIVLQRDSPASLSGRRVDICVLDDADDGPAFGARALAALREPGAPLAALDIGFEHRRYDWREVAGLEAALELARSRGALVTASSEGGLFEYGADADIVQNLRALAEGTRGAAFVVGSVTRDDEVIRTLKLTSTAATQPRGLATFSRLAERAGFRVTRSVARPLSDQVVLMPQAD